MPKDPRYFQIIFLSSFLALGHIFLNFQVTPLQCLLTLGVGIFAQYLFLHIFHVPNKNFLSALITILSLCLLLRSNTLWVHPVACTLAIGSKFLLRHQSRHFFNPANFGIIACIFLFPAWVSQGQWGHQSILVGGIILLGFVVTQRAKVGWVSLMFLSGYTALIFFRNLYLGFEWALTKHALLNGALLIFTFFMISDPKTNPQSISGKALHLTFIISIFGVLQFVFYVPNALFIALFLAAPFLWVWDHITDSTLPRLSS